MVNQDDPDVLEIWNLVFMQYVREKSRDGSTTTLEQLREKHIDTGMGLERLASILQNQTSNYKIDHFQNIMNEIYTLRQQQNNITYNTTTDNTTNNTTNNTTTTTTSTTTTSTTTTTTINNKNEDPILPYQDGVGDIEDPNGIDAAYRVVADHARTLVFAIGDQVQPSNIGRGYVLRRILRRGVLYGERTLKLNTSFFSQLVPIIVDTYHNAYPNLKINQQHIIETIEKEEGTVFQN